MGSKAHRSLHGNNHSEVSNHVRSSVLPSNGGGKAQLQFDWCSESSDENGEFRAIFPWQHDQSTSSLKQPYCKSSIAFGIKDLFLGIQCESEYLDFKGTFEGELILRNGGPLIILPTILVQTTTSPYLSPFNGHKNETHC